MSAIAAWEPREETPYGDIRARQMSRVLLVLIVAVLPQIPMQVILGPAEIALLPAVFVLIYVAALILLLRGRQQIAASVVVWSSVFALAASATMLGGLRGTTTPFIGLGAMVAVSWLDRLNALAAIIAYGLLLALLPALDEASANLGLRILEHHSAAMSISYALATLLAVGLVGPSTDALAKTLGEASARGEEAQAAKAMAEQAIEMKSRFLATMSHELRTPLNAIIGYAEMLREDSDKGREDLDRIERSGRQLLSLVGDVLEVTRRETRPQRQSEVSVDLRIAVIREFDALARLGLAKGSLSVDGQRQIVCDPDLVRAVISNLLRHALSSNTLEIEVSLHDGRMPLTLRAEHHRTGIGLALAQRFSALMRAEILQSDSAISLQLSAEER